MYIFTFQPSEKENDGFIHMRVYENEITLTGFVMSMYDTIENLLKEQRIWLEKDLTNYYCSECGSERVKYEDDLCHDCQYLTSTEQVNI